MKKYNKVNLDKYDLAASYVGDYYRSRKVKDGLLLAWYISILVVCAVSWWHGLNLIFAASKVLGFISLFLEGSQFVAAWADWGWHYNVAQFLADALHLAGK
jgi:hypothetical protein